MSARHLLRRVASAVAATSSAPAPTRGALLAEPRARTGEGQHVRIAMLDAMLSYLWPEGMAPLTYVSDGDEVAFLPPVSGG